MAARDELRFLRIGLGSRRARACSSSCRRYDLTTRTTFDDGGDHMKKPFALTSDHCLVLTLAGFACTSESKRQHRVRLRRSPPAARARARQADGGAPRFCRPGCSSGDTHLHTSYSPDAYLMQNRSADPDTAYRYAKGYPVVHPYHRARIQIETPLDFLVVSDHGEFMGVHPEATSRRSVGRQHQDRKALPEDGCRSRQRDQSLRAS